MSESEDFTVIPVNLRQDVLMLSPTSHYHMGATTLWPFPSTLPQVFVQIMLSEFAEYKINPTTIFLKRHMYPLLHLES